MPTFSEHHLNISSISRYEDQKITNVNTATKIEFKTKANKVCKNKNKNKIQNKNKRRIQHKNKNRIQKKRKKRIQNKNKK